MAKKQAKSWSGLLTFLMVLAILSYLGYQIYRSVFSVIKTELAVNYSVYESVEAQGLIFRSETVIPSVSNGHCYYTVTNGARVAKDGVIASVYSSENDGLLAQQISEIDAHIAILRGLQSNDSSAHITLDIIDTQLMNTLNTLIVDAGDGMFEQSVSVKNDLLSLLSKKQIITGKKVDFSAEIAKLEQQKKELSSQYRSALSVIKAPVAGYFVDNVDGYESLLSSVDPSTLSTTKLRELMSAQPSVTDQGAGKIVGGYEWFFACVVPESFYNTLSVGSSISLKMNFVSDEEIPVTVAACNKDNEGNLAVVFRCAYMSEDLSDIRKETAQLLILRHTGLKVPKRAVVINDEMEAGVYIRSGNVAVFRKIEQIYSEPADYVISKIVDESGYLQLYDDIIVSGKGLYDGKSIE